MSEENQRLHAEIFGRVQGVNFRYYTRKEAHRRGLTGWITNRPDGSVEVVAEGTKRELQRLLSFLQSGPPAARVERVETEWAEASGEFKRFRVRY